MLAPHQPTLFHDFSLFCEVDGNFIHFVENVFLFRFFIAASKKKNKKLVTQIIAQFIDIIVPFFVSLYTELYTAR